MDTEPGEEPDADFWASAIDGNGGAFGVIYDRHRDRVFRHALRLIISIPDAEDVTAMVFLEAWRRRDAVRMVNGSVVAWLLVTTNNVVRNHARSQRRYRAFLDRLPPPDAVEDPAEHVAEEDERQARARSLAAAFARLSGRDRDVLTLCVLEELSTAQAGTVLGVPEGTVKSRLSRAKRRLAQSFTGDLHTRDPEPEGVSR
jgi:RNA polymerase sigma factor (sigma-70 family)